MIEKMGGRKFLGFIIVSVLLLVLVLINKITGDTFVQFLTVNLGIYTVGNVGENVTDKIK